MANEKNRPTERDETSEKRGFFSGIKITILLVLLGGLIWSVGKENRTVRGFFDRFVAAQRPVSETLIHARGTTMGTEWNVKILASTKEWPVERLTEMVQQKLDQIDGMMSTYKDDSEVARFNRSDSTDWFSVSPETAQVVALAITLTEKTGGAFDITVAPLVNLWRFGPDKSPLSRLPDESTLDSVRAECGSKHLEVKIEDEIAIRKSIPNLQIDLSAIAKGFAVDSVFETLRAANIENLMVDVGGEVRCGGTKSVSSVEFPAGRPWLLGIEKPILSRDAPPELYRTVIPGDQSLATSGNSRNFSIVDGHRFSHIIDPRTGAPLEIRPEGSPRPERETASVSVFAPSCADADGLATGFYVMGPEAGIELANRLNIPLLYLLRVYDGTETRLTERASNRFADIESVRTEEP